MNFDEIFTLIMDLPGIIVGIFTKGMHTIVAGLMPLIIMALIIWVILKYLSAPTKNKQPVAKKEGVEP
ncbi:MAG: hypothetical protein HQL69_06995 [Magnetococcales bacterium]|nr:hypothetical protein [Magnetococcales bacterium]